jgi:hypothetical protein
MRMIESEQPQITWLLLSASPYVAAAFRSIHRSNWRLDSLKMQSNESEVTVKSFS